MGAAVADGADLGGAEVELSEHAARNRAEWNVWAAEYVEAGRRALGGRAITWGITSVPEAEARVLPALDGRDVLEAGCGTAYVSAWLARRGARVDRHRRLRGAARDGAPLPAGVRGRVPARARQRRGAPVRRRVVRPRRLGVRREHLGRPVRLDPGGGARATPGRAHRPARERDAARPLPARTLDADLPAGTRFQRPYFGMHRFEWPDDNSVDFHLGYGDWIALFGANGFEVEELVELQGDPERSRAGTTSSRPRGRRSGRPRRSGARASAA